jgi:hypothetical protein
MANLIDTGFLNNFTEVFMFLLIFAVIYGVLSKVDFFKLNEKGKGLNAIIAITIALLTLMSGEVTAMIGTMVPWFFVLILFIMLVMLSTMIFGTSNEEMMALIRKPEAYSWIIIFGAIILLFSLGSGFGQNLLDETDTTDSNGDFVTKDEVFSNTEFSGEQSTDTGDYESNLVLTLFHPKVLGLLLLGLVGLMAALFLTKLEE